MSVRQHDFTIERRFRQSPEQTFQAFANPGLRQRWFRVPDSWTETEWSLDFPRALSPSAQEVKATIPTAWGSAPPSQTPVSSPSFMEAGSGVAASVGAVAGLAQELGTFAGGNEISIVSPPSGRGLAVSLA